MDDTVHDDKEATASPTQVERETDAEHRRTAVEHMFLDRARNYDWPELAAALRWDPTLVNAQPAGRWTALHQAVRAGERSVVEWLLSARADTTLKNNEGATPADLTWNPQLRELLTAARDGRVGWTAPLPAPTAVGGYLPKCEGGNVMDYYWPPGYTYEQTFRWKSIAASANPQWIGTPASSSSSPSTSPPQ